MSKDDPGPVAQTARADIRPQVVIVDDDSTFLLLVQDWLKPQFDVVCIVDGQELIDILHTLNPDLFILDVRLPGENGFALCQKLRQDARFHSVPIVFLTASKDERDYFNSMKAGGTAYLTKPIDRRQLLYKLRDILAKK